MVFSKRMLISSFAFIDITDVLGLVTIIGFYSYAGFVIAAVVISLRDVYSLLFPNVLVFWKACTFVLIVNFHTFLNVLHPVFLT